MSTSKKNSSESVEAAGKVDMTGWTLEQKRVFKLNQLKAKAKKQAQLIKAAQKVEMKKSCMPVGKAILEKATALKLDIVVSDAVNYFGAGWILVKMIVGLKGEEQENLLKMIEKYSSTDTTTISFLNRIAKITEKQKVQTAQKKVEEFKIEPDDGQIPY